MKKILEDYKKGKIITGLKQAQQLEDVVVFHAGTAEKDRHIVTNGGRVLGVTALAENIEDAKQKAYAAIEKITFEDAYYRRDIADKAMKRVKEN